VVHGGRDRRLESRAVDDTGRSVPLLGSGDHDSFDTPRGVSPGTALDRGADKLDPPVARHRSAGAGAHQGQRSYFSTLSRRARSLELPAQPRATGGAIHLMVDSSGLKVGGPGEWLLEKHGTSRRRWWRKLHIGFDTVTGRIVAAILTDRDIGDTLWLSESTLVNWHSASSAW
jgi:hypothetical protein